MAQTLSPIITTISTCDCFIRRRWCHEWEIEGWSDFHCTLGLCRSVAKALLVLITNKNGHGTVLPSCLERYSIEECAITRWSQQITIRKLLKMEAQVLRSKFYKDPLGG